MSTFTLSKRLSRLWRSLFGILRGSPLEQAEVKKKERPLEFEKLNATTRQALEDVDKGKDVSRAKSVDDMLKQLDL